MRSLLTEISHGSGATDYRSLKFWNKILRDELKISPAGFWACVKLGVIPERDADGECLGAARRRGAGEPEEPEDSGGTLLSPATFHSLRLYLGMSEADMVGLSEEQGQERLAQHWEDQARQSGDR